ncbi:hypothetical protein HMPREF0578_1865 [Mobiluncus mulieris 28-1]|uniref:SCO6880 family protein n=1 Tax=Mobiluncus mulieris TaxID=2052 RepID=UPI0001BE7E81|nr:SCO6880 family protein [Mobiluncus mulieris]EEZ90864.1 hypothetical protein HMPREF0578_1865 [Mobiluncus mulieris 28-1]MCU9971147.1 PrgI family protein [Mobiluncus mulieris]NMW90747.1 PrgI family protein [Mobiluncus mulieris]
MSASHVQPEQIPRSSTRGLLLGLGATPVAALLAGVVLFIVLTLVFGFNRALWGFPLWGGLMLSGLIPVGDRKLVEWLPIGIGLMTRKLTRQDRYRYRILSPRPDGTLALPGRAAALRLVEDVGTGAALIHDPNGKTLVAIGRVSHGDFLLLSDEAKQEKSVLFARMVSTLALSDGIWRIQVLTRSIPDSGYSISQYWEQMKAQSLSAVASESYEDLIQELGGATERHETLLAISLDLRKCEATIKAYGGGITGAVKVMAERMVTAETATQSAQLKISEWLTRPELAHLIRTTYDPAAAVELDQHPSLGQYVPHAGPMAVQENWATYETDSAIHKTMLISWPGIPAWPGFLRPLVVHPGIRVAFSLIFEPIPRDKAMSSAKREVINEAIAAAERQRSGQISTILNDQDEQAATQHLADVAAGHTDVWYAGLVTVSAKGKTELTQAVESVKSSAIEAGCELRVLYGQQATLFPAAALPLCQGLPKFKGVGL